MDTSLCHALHGHGCAALRSGACPQPSHHQPNEEMQPGPSHEHTGEAGWQLGCCYEAVCGLENGLQGIFMNQGPFSVGYIPSAGAAISNLEPCLLFVFSPPGNMSMCKGQSLFNLLLIFEASSDLGKGETN